MIHPTLHRSFALFLLYKPPVTHIRVPALSPVASQGESMYVDGLWECQTTSMILPMNQGGPRSLGVFLLLLQVEALPAIS
jgi:hypothetical protein